MPYNNLLANIDITDISLNVKMHSLKLTYITKRSNLIGYDSDVIFFYLLDLATMHMYSDDAMHFRVHDILTIKLPFKFNSDSGISLLFYCRTASGLLVSDVGCIRL